MNLPRLHPALVQLLWFQTTARFRQLGNAFTTPRRVILSAVAILLAAVWLGNAVIAILLREPADPEVLRKYVPLGLMAYGLWHLVKVAYRRPEQAIEWTPSEEHLLVGGPFPRSQLLLYRFAGIAIAAVLKAGVFVLLMLPDLKLPLVAMTAAVLALCLLEGWRMAVEIAAWGLSRRAYQVARVAVLAFAAAIGGCCLWPSEAAATSGAWGFVSGALERLVTLRATPIGQVLSAPAEVFANLMAAQQFSAALLGQLALAVSFVAGLAWMVIRLDGWVHRAEAQRAVRVGQSVEADRGRDAGGETPLKLACIPWLWGAGPIAWRQLLGARRYSSSLLVAMAAPLILSALPLFSFESAEIAVINAIGAAVFYSFLLLPAALKFDFQRDLDRMVVLKTLPIRPTAVVLGQLATPVLIATAFQCGIVLMAVVVRPVSPILPLVAISLFLPLNVLIFALDNVLYLYYPYRLNEESLRIFLRSTLVFTGKGVLFGIGVAVTFLWSLTAQTLGSFAGAGESATAALFALGLYCMIATAAATVAGLLVHAYQQFDPSRDTP